MSTQQEAPSTEELAAEYVLGTLSATRRRMVEQRLPADAMLESAVQRWHEQLLPLVALAEPAEPSAQLWQRIERSVAHAVAPRRPAILPVPQPWWNSLGLWRGMAGAGFATAAIMAAVLVTRQGMLPTGPQYMVVLVAPQDTAPGWVIQTSNTRQLSLTPLGKVVVPAEKSLQFWTKAEGWSGPVSLGLVKPGQTVHIPLDKLPPLQPNQLFELTLEPVKGSPTNRPTGPIQFIGRAVKVL